MPTYVYKFIDTGETIEVQQAFSDDALTEAVHPASGETMPVKKVFLPVGVSFKGGGFYKTDSRGGSSTSGSSTAAGSASGDASSSSSSSDSSSSSSDTPAKSSSAKPSSGESSSSTSTPAAAPAKAASSD